MQDTHIVLFFLHIAGAVALLIWSVRLVRTGVERAFANQVRLWMRKSSTNRPLAAATGAVSAMLLQSSTAVVVMVSNFVSSNGIVAAAGLAILLGADVGSALIVQVLLVRQAFLVPLFLLVGVVLFLRGKQRRVRQFGRIFIGVALIFASLDMIREATAPLVDSEGAAAVMAYLGRDALTAFLIGAAFTWIVHSSVASILLFAAFAAQGLMPQSAAVTMVLGANLGSALIAYVLTLSSPIEARRVIVSNAVVRGGSAGLVLFLLTITDTPLTWIGATETSQIINLHVLFNLGLAVVFLPLCNPIVRLAKHLMRAPLDPTAGLDMTSALDPASLDVPDRALICATREIIHMAETIETMLPSANVLYQKWDDTLATAIKDKGKRVSKMHFDIKLFLANLNRAALDEDTSRKSMELSTLAANLEAASDVIAQNMLGLAQQLDRESVRFSKVGQDEITDFHDRVLANVQLALHVLMTQDLSEARQLVAEKEDMRGLEQELQRKHLSRLRDGLTESISTSSIHQETLRALKQINTSFSMIAHPILSETGDLLESRLATRSSD